jgi:predicted DNA repair protein MutK
MSSGLLALLDDVAAIAKVAAAALDDAAAQAAKAGSKAMGIVIDDAAVTPRYVVGFAAERELPIVAKIAWGSLKNKMVFLLPGALVLSLIAPWAITPLLMFGGAFLCYEGYEKVMEFLGLGGHHHDDGPSPVSATAGQMEAEKVSSAIRTDFILSAEIMAIALATLAVETPLWAKAAALAVVGLGMTLLVYGAVAIIVKADDVGAAMALRRSPVVSAIGRAIVMGMPGFLKALSFVGMIAMLWVGGGILIHGLYELGVDAPEHVVKGAADAVGAAAGPASGIVGWAVGAGLAAIVGLAVGALIAPLADRLLAPVLKSVHAWWMARMKLS